jgi:hypothetical protein
MMQPIVAQGVFTNEMMKHQGILARCLVSMPESIQGTRLHRPTNIETSEILHGYNDHIYNLLSTDRFRMNPDDGSLVLETIRVHQGTSAYDDWVGFYNDVESGLLGKYQPIVPAAAKMPEQVVRIAGIMAVLRGTREISSDDMVNAMYLGKYYLDSLLSVERGMAGDKELNDLEEMVVWFRQYCSATGSYSISSRNVLRDSPYKLHKRNKDAVRKLMHGLENHGLVRISKWTGQLNPRPTQWEIMPDMMTIDLSGDDDSDW